MGDISDVQQSEVTRITGGDENGIADVTYNSETEKNELHVNASGNVNTSVDGSGLVIYTIQSTQSMSETFVDVVSSTGKGFLGGFKFQFSNENAEVRVEIDGVESFKLTPTFLRDLNFETFTDSGLNRWFGAQQYGEFEFFPSNFIGYNVSLKVQIRKTQSWNITTNFGMVIYS